ncbi:OsmC-like protein [Nitratireductor aquibiodomus]|uniref:OsmC-like protein n=1 Tax=Nitratireductor aquibiodomus TaxID=204799 RepID=A0A1H4L1S6_9HYPH|nr:OsmC family protein [Nitratireductor aquibiodomus]SEB64720.1 OsmC-like protein [Nitratireductor aquibiodomus]
MRPANIIAEQNHPLAIPLRAAPGTLLAPSPRLGNSTRTVVRSLTVMQKEALISEANSDRTWRLLSDEGAYLNGHDEAPPPLAYLSAGMVASYLNEIHALADIRQIEIDDIEIIQDNFYSMNGSFAKGTMTASAHDIELKAKIKSRYDSDTLRSLILDSIASSPLNGLMRGAKESLFRLCHNGSEIGISNGKEIAAPLLPAFDEEKFDIMEGDWDAVIEHTRQPSPIMEDTTTFAGGALTETQNRMLHLRVHAKRQPDGIVKIRQHVYNPHGSAFHFTSDEAGRAPSAAALISAGIGFCFMTQFGRYAAMIKKPLKSYQIIQDFHFSRGGATGKTGKAGEAAPLETHVHIQSDESDSFAKTMLEVAEQTCFLHAFCRTPLKAKLKISSLGSGLID